MKFVSIHTQYIKKDLERDPFYIFKISQNLIPIHNNVIHQSCSKDDGTVNRTLSVNPLKSPIPTVIYASALGFP